MASGFDGTTRSLVGETPAMALILWTLAALLLAAWFGWFFLSQVTVYEVSHRARLEVRQSAHPVTATVPSKVLVNRMVLGREVLAGEVLVELDASAERGRLGEAQSRLASYPYRLLSLQRETLSVQRALEGDAQSFAAALTAARARVQEVGVTADHALEIEGLVRADNLAGGASLVDALRAGAETRRLAAARDALLADVRRIEGDAQARRHQQQAQIESLASTTAALLGEQSIANATVARLRQDVEQLTIRAPASGVLGEVAPMGPGSFVTQGQKLATVVPRGDLIIVAEFLPAAVLGHIQAGQLGRMRLDGFPWTEYGTVAARVSRVATEIRDQHVRVELTPEASALALSYLQHGLPGVVEVGIGQASPSTLILRAAGQLTNGGARASGAPSALAPS